MTEIETSGTEERFCIKMYGYTFRGNNSVTFSFASLLNRGQLSKERICSSKSKFYRLRVDPILELLHHPEKQKGSLESLKVCKWKQNMTLYPCTVQILCIGTGRSQQTVQTKIRLLLKKQSDQGLRCLPFHQHLFDALMQCFIKLFYS